MPITTARWKIKILLDLVIELSLQTLRKSDIFYLVFQNWVYFILQMLKQEMKQTKIVKGKHGGTFVCHLHQDLKVSGSNLILDPLLLASNTE